MAPRVLLVDNFDSFTHNVAHGLRAAGAVVAVRRADAFWDRPTPSGEPTAPFGAQLPRVEGRAPDLLVISPGPGRPEDAHLSLELVRRFYRELPILGICLGHQVLAVAFGGRVGRAPEPVHGKVCPVFHDGRGLFAGLPSPLEVGRYHSLMITDLPPELEPCAWTEDGLLMGLRHRELPLAGLQFHPDSFLSPSGPEMFRHALLLGH